MLKKEFCLPVPNQVHFRANMFRAIYVRNPCFSTEGINREAHSLLRFRGICVFVAVEKNCSARVPRHRVVLTKLVNSFRKEPNPLCRSSLRPPQRDFWKQCTVVVR